MATCEQLHTLLDVFSDGEYHTGTEMGEMVGMTRAGIWKMLQNVKQLGYEIDSVTGKGYRINRPIDLLKKEQLTHCLQDPIKQLDIEHSIESTNDYLLARIFERSKLPRICMAEQQTKGKGRRGRVWHSPFGQNIYYSLLWQFEIKDSKQLQALSLVVGLAVVKMLNKLGFIDDIKLKWPNDIYWRDKKLGGILIETRGDLQAHHTVVIGIGLNVYMQAIDNEQIENSWTSLQNIIDGCDNSINKLSLSRNQIANSLTNELLSCFEQFSKYGFAAFVESWGKFDWSKDKIVMISTPTTDYTGVAKGVDELGQLQLQLADGEIKKFMVGEVRLRQVHEHDSAIE